MVLAARLLLFSFLMKVAPQDNEDKSCKTKERETDVRLILMVHRSTAFLSYYPLLPKDNSLREKCSSWEERAVRVHGFFFLSSHRQLSSFKKISKKIMDELSVGKEESPGFMSYERRAVRSFRKKRTC